MAGIEGLKLSDRALKLLSDAKVTEVEALRTYDRAGLIALPGIGEATADEILKALEGYEEIHGIMTALKRHKETPDNAEPIVESDAELIGDIQATESEEIWGEEMVGEADETVEALTKRLRWAIAVFERQPGRQGQHLAGQLRQSVLKVRTDLTIEEFTAMEGALD